MSYLNTDTDHDSQFHLRASIRRYQINFLYVTD